MSWRERLAVVGTLALASPSLVAQTARDAPPGVIVTVEDLARHLPEQFGGIWDYNPRDSVNAATGRPEQNPRSATTRVPVAGAAPTGERGGGAPRGGGGGVGGGGRGFRGGGDLALGPTPEMLQERRDASRDLLEVPEALIIRVVPGAVTFVDDLEREWTYPTSGEEQRYQIGTARIAAAVTWNGPRLLKRMEGPYGLRVTETYFLSSDAQRLFVMVRVGDQRKGQPPIGFNRVYDRVE